LHLVGQQLRIMLVLLMGERKNWENAAWSIILATERCGKY